MASGKEFGRRSLEAQMRADEVLRAEGQNPDSEASNAGSGWGMAIYAAEILVLVAVAFGIVTFVTRGVSFGTQVVGGYAAPVAAIEQPAIDAPPLPAATRTSLDIVRKSCEETRNNIRPYTDEDSFGGFAKGGLKFSGLENEVQMSAAYANCLMSNNPRRLCQAADKEDVVQAVNSYFVSLKAARGASGLASTVISIGMQMNTDPDVSEAYRQIANESKARLTASAPSASLDARIASNLRGLAAIGIVKASDFGGLFGMFTPKEVADILKDVKISRQECAR